eukprot:4339131-Pyramimonas_sp.AAC.1
MPKYTLNNVMDAGPPCGNAVTKRLLPNVLSLFDRNHTQLAADCPRPIRRCDIMMRCDGQP